MSPVDWTNMNGIMDNAYKVCSYVRGYVPPMCREHGDRDTVAYFNGKLDAYRFILTSDMLDTKK